MNRNSDNDMLNYGRIAEAIAYIGNHFKEQPSLDEIAEKIHLSPSHFQRLFTEWAGTSPKKFLQYISVSHAKKLLSGEQPLSLFDTTFETGLSATSRLHDLFISIEGMTPAEYRDGGTDLNINYAFYPSPFGKILVASTAKGICHMVFEENETIATANLQLQFPNAQLQNAPDTLQTAALKIFSDSNNPEQIKLHLKGSNFQLKVWESLLKIPMGALTTYGYIAEAIGHKGASRAVGTAVGSNPVAYLIPCHRVIRSSGIIGDYMWGSTRKKAIIGWESAQTTFDNALL